jgi:outer membrane protein assembly factor BamB
VPGNEERRTTRARKLFVRASRTLLVFGLATLAACGGSGKSQKDWPLPNLDVSSTRALPGSGIDRVNVHRLHVVWRFRFPFQPGESGAFSATPTVANGVVYLQDMRSNVFALDLETGRILWRHLFNDPNPGPNGLSIGADRVYGATNTAVFALSPRTGRLLWHRFLLTPAGPLVGAKVTPVAQVLDVAPLVADGTVFVSTVGFPPGGRGTLYALSKTTGVVRWRLSTIKGNWAVPGEAGGGGAWYPPSVADGDVFWGSANPYPYGGSRRHPNGGAYRGPALYTDSLLAVDARTGKLHWYDQVTSHDVRDYDFELPPILATVGGKARVFGAGKGGIAIAWDTGTHRRAWTTEVGVHRHDTGALPFKKTSVCPGLLGGVKTPMAYSSGTLFLPIVDLCMEASAYGYERLGDVDVSRGRGELVALHALDGTRAWTKRLPQPDFGCATVADGVVFTSTLDGKVYGLDTRNGATLWSTRLSAGINACPALAGDMLLIGAGVKRAKGDVLELTALSVSH